MEDSPTAAEAARLHMSLNVDIPLDDAARTFWQDQIAAAIEADRAQIAAALASRSHKDDWGVPCVYVEHFSRTVLGIEIEVR